MYNGNNFPMRAMGQMHQQMLQDMDMMMEGMMDGMLGRSMGGGPFGMPGGFGMAPPMMRGFPGPLGMPFGQFMPISDGTGRQPTRRRQELEMNPFGGLGGLLGAMGPGMSGGNVFMSTSVMTMGPDGKPRVEESTMHTTGGVTETKRRVEKDGESHMTIGHSIGDRQHVIEKKRDKDGNVRKQQKFVNLDEESAEDFDREFARRVRTNYGYPTRPMTRDPALEYGRSSRPRTNGTTTTATSSSSSRAGTSSRHAPIITLPEEEETNGSHSSSQRIGGPVIREISDEEAEQSIPKRRKGLFGGYRAE